jgi:hypothetical protein
MFLASVEHQRQLLKIVLIVIMVVAAFLMLATLSMMVTEKTADIGILTAMGGTPWGVSVVFLACGLVITAVGVVLGLVSGCLTVDLPRGDPPVRCAGRPASTCSRSTSTTSTACRARSIRGGCCRSSAIALLTGFRRVAAAGLARRAARPAGLAARHLSRPLPARRLCSR